MNLNKFKHKIADGFENIFNKFHESVNSLLGRKYCYNLLDLKLKNCSRCISATNAGVMLSKKMDEKYGPIIRHIKCRCNKMFVKGQELRGPDKDLWQSQIGVLEDNYGDLGEIERKFNESQKPKPSKNDFDEEMEANSSYLSKLLTILLS